MLKKIQTVVAVFLRDGRMYLQKRPPGGLFAGLWELPGGEVEPGETPRQAIRQEVEEELGVRCEVGQRLDRFKHYYTAFEVTLHAFFCDAPQGLPQDETRRWVAPQDALRYPMPSANRRLVRGIEELVKNS